MTAPYRLRGDGIDVFVRLTPKSSLDRLEGVEESADGRGHFKARVRAAPENGLANAALVKVVAKTLGTPVSAISVAAGSTSRLKTLRVTGDPDTLAATVERLMKR